MWNRSRLCVGEWGFTHTPWGFSVAIGITGDFVFVLQTSELEVQVLGLFGAAKLGNCKSKFKYSDSN